MRVRTDSRRQAILEVATEIFREVGYARASMAMISARLGGSKGTLYGYFKSKEDLFAAAMMALMEDQADETIKLLDQGNVDLRRVLCTFGNAYLALLTSPDALAVLRTAIAEGMNSDLGQTLYRLGCERSWNEVAAYIDHLQSNGLIREATPMVAAAHLKGLLETGIVEPKLFGARTWFERGAAVDEAVDVFLRAYGADRA